MAVEAANYPNTSVVNVGDLFPPAHPFQNSSIPDYWTSPLTSQKPDIVSTSQIETQIVQLAKFVHRWLATFPDEENDRPVPSDEVLEERVILRQMIECFTPITRTSNSELEAMYECCRWASLILLSIEKLHIPMHVAAKHVRIKPRLLKRLRMTDLTNLWGIRKGLLFWVTAICHFSSAGQCFPLLCTTLFARFAQEMAMSDCCYEIAIKPLRRLKLFESLCCRPDQTIKVMTLRDQIPRQN